MPRLFDMSDADIDRAVEAHWDRVWEEQNDDSGLCCKYCLHYNCPFCTYYDGVYPEKDEDDWCEHFDAEDFYVGEDF